MRRRWPSAARWPWPWRSGFESRFRTNKSNVRRNNKDEELGGDVGVGVGDGGGRVVNVLAFYSDDPSSNSADVYIFCKKLFE